MNYRNVRHHPVTDFVACGIAVIISATPVSAEPAHAPITVYLQSSGTPYRAAKIDGVDMSLSRGQSHRCARPSAIRHGDAGLLWGLADFHSIARSRRTGVVDTITWAVAVMTLYLDVHAPQGANAGKIVAVCAEGGLGGGAVVRNAITFLHQGGMIAVDRSPGAGRAHRVLVEM